MKLTLFVKKIIFSAIFASFAGLLAYSQTPSQKKSLRIQIWSELDEIPGVFSFDDGSEEEQAANSVAESTSKAVQTTAAQSAAKENCR